MCNIIESREFSIVDKNAMIVAQLLIDGLFCSYFFFNGCTIGSTFKSPHGLFGIPILNLKS